MSFENFELLDNESIDNSIVKKYYLKAYHHQQANLDDPHQNIEFIFGDDNNCHPIGKAYLHFDITIRQGDCNNFNNDSIRLINNAFAYTFKEALLATTGGSDLEHNNYVGQGSTIMRLKFIND